MGIKQISSPISCRHWIGRFGEQKLIRWVCHCSNQHNPESHHCDNYSDVLSLGLAACLFRISFSVEQRLIQIFNNLRIKSPHEPRQTNFKKVDVWPNPVRLEQCGCKCQPLRVIEEFHYWRESWPCDKEVHSFILLKVIFSDQRYGFCFGEDFILLCVIISSYFAVCACTENLIKWHINDSPLLSWALLPLPFPLLPSSLGLPQFPSFCSCGCGLHCVISFLLLGTIWDCPDYLASYPTSWLLKLECGLFFFRQFSFQTN